MKTLIDEKNVFKLNKQILSKYFHHLFCKIKTMEMLGSFRPVLKFTEDWLGARPEKSGIGPEAE